MSSLWQDIRFGLRTMLKDVGFFTTAVLALALAIGSATAIFSVIDNVLLRPFPYTAGERLFGINIHDSSASDPQAGRNWFTIPEFLDYQQHNRIFDEAMGVWETTVLMGDANAPESLDTDTVTGNTFQFLGVAPLLGRGILPSDAQPGAPRVFVLSYKVWVKRFGLDPKIVGQTFLLDHKPTTLIGIMPQRFAFWGGDIWMPALLDRAAKGPNNRFVLYGRLKAGLQPKSAEGDIRLLAARLAKIYPNSYPKHFDVQLQSLVDIAVGKFKPTLLTLLAAVGLLLLIGCANVANLLLAKTAGREKELAIRKTMGAGRFRIVRQLIVESVLLAVAGAALGCLFAWAGLAGLVLILPQFTFPDEAAIELNLPVLFATMATALLTALIFGIAPALIASQRDLNDPLKTSGRGNSSFRRGRFQNALIVCEVAFSLLLLSSAGLLMHSFFVERQVDLGYRSDHILTTRLNLPAKLYKDTASQSRFLRELLARLENAPGVVSVAGALEEPRLNGGIPTDFDLPGVTHSETWKGYMAPVSWKYFQTLGVHLVAGRLLTAADDAGKRQVAVINRSMATQYFGRQNPIGRQLQFVALNSAKGASEPVLNPAFEIVGIVNDLKNGGLRQATVPEAYIPYTIAGYGAYCIFVRTLGDPNAFSTTLTRAVLSLDPGVIPQGTISMEDDLDVSQYAKPRFGLILFSVFAGIGLVLVSVGVYGVVSYTVAQQQHEIGIRMALGASARDVRSLVITSGLRFVIAGVCLGSLLTLATARLLSNQIWGVAWYDPLTLGAVMAILTMVGLSASYLPSLRATRVDPAICLRLE